MITSFDYTAFEASFRGSHHEIKTRLSVYLPFIKLLSLKSKQPALDIACGRGEWLMLLKENVIAASGVDINHDSVAHCNSLGLDVIQADLFDVFNAPGKTSYGLISGFHIIEHLSFDQQMILFNTVFSLLAPGGAVILETPNPENVTVGTCNFFIDPTHLRPVPPSLMHFLAVQAGFSSPVIVRLNRSTVGEPIAMMRKEIPGAAQYNRLIDIVASRLLQAPDYALIAFKPPAPDFAMLEAVAAINRMNDSFVLPPAADEIADEMNNLQLLERTMELEHELHHLQEVLRQKEATLNAIKKTTHDERRPIPFNEYPKTIRKSCQKLSEARLKAKNKTV